MEKQTFGEWLDIWFETFKKPNLKPYSVRNIEQIIRLHTPAWLKEKPITKITPLDIERALAEIPPSRTRKYARGEWYNAFKKAYRLGYVPRNIMEQVDNVKYQKQRHTALTRSEQEAFIKALEEKRYKWLMFFYLYSGVRRSEALSIEWKDINEEEETITIHGTKTDSSFRQIVLTPDLKYILEEQKKQNAAEREQPKRGNYHKCPESVVFPFSAQQVSRYFKAVCPNHNLHDLRHTYITRCAESGINVNVCQALVGHSTANMTLNVYTHVMDDFKRREAKKYTITPNFNGM